MKKQPMTIALLVVVAAVWGVVLYRITTHLGSDETNVEKASIAPSSKEKREVRLMLDYRDPFGRVPHQRQIAVLPPKTETPKIVQPDTSPQFRYKGMVEHKQHRVAVIENNGGQVLMNVNDSIDRYKLITITTDSISVTRNNKKFILKK